MSSPNTRHLRTAIAALALAWAGASAWSQVTPSVMIDTAPLPAEDRNSMGALVIDPAITGVPRPMATPAMRDPTTMMGGPPAPDPRKAGKSEKELENERALEAEKQLRQKGDKPADQK